MAEIFRNASTALPRPENETLMTRSQAAPWQETGTPGFLIKPLFEDATKGQRTWLMKVDPGAEAPLHAHDEVEQIFVIEGTFYDDENTYGPGDFAIRAPGVPHRGGSKDGAVMMLVYS